MIDLIRPHEYPKQKDWETDPFVFEPLLKQFNRLWQESHSTQ